MALLTVTGIKIKNYASEIGCKFTQINRIDKWFYKECFRQPYLWILWMMGKNAAAFGGEVLWKAGSLTMKISGSGFYLIFAIAV